MGQRRGSLGVVYENMMCSCIIELRGSARIERGGVQWLVSNKVKAQERGKGISGLRLPFSPSFLRVYFFICFSHLHEGCC